MNCAEFERCTVLWRPGMQDQTRWGKSRQTSRQKRRGNEKGGGGDSYFFLVSPKSNAAVTPTTTYVPALSSKHATTNGRLFLLLLDPLKIVPGVLSLNASTNHSASLDNTPG